LFRKLRKKYPDLEESAAANFAKKEYRDFFRYNMHRDYPNIGRAAAKRLAEKILRAFSRMA